MLLLIKTMCLYFISVFLSSNLLYNGGKFMNKTLFWDRGIDRGIFRKERQTELLYEPRKIHYFSELLVSRGSIVSVFMVLSFLSLCECCNESWMSRKQYKHGLGTPQYNYTMQ